jgi:hypothetical protein
MKRFQVFYASDDTIQACVECVEGQWSRPLNGQTMPLTLPVVLSSFTPPLKFSLARIEEFMKEARPGSVFQGEGFLVVCLLSERQARHAVRQNA